TYAQQRIKKNSARVDILQDKFNRELTSEQGIKLLKTIGEKRQVYADTHSIVNKTFLSFIFNGLFSC
ncbi:hypothetical protein OCZ39_005113, partial [Citrobacter freundii]|nr:hypothetical protein [Citrobacter freundii]